MLRQRPSEAIILIMIFTEVLACTHGNLCDKDYPCSGNEICLEGVCQVKSKTSILGVECDNSPVICGPSLICVKENSGNSFCRQSCNQDDLQNCPSKTTCNCTVDPRVGYCNPNPIPTHYCNKYQAPGDEIKGFCSLRCEVGEKYWCSCPPKLFGQSVSCQEKTLLCFPNQGYEGADLMPHRCLEDSDCKGVMAQP